MRILPPMGLAAWIVLTAACSPRPPTTFSGPARPKRNFVACQLRSVTHAPPSDPDLVTEAQLGTNGVLHVKTTRGVATQSDLVTDGERRFALNKQGRYEEVPGGAAILWAEWQGRFNPDVSRISRGDALLIGQDEVAGHPATVYRWTNGEGTARPEQVTMWIADVGFQPLKVESRRPEAASASSEAPTAEVVTRFYGYDPTVEVALPTP